MAEETPTPSAPESGAETVKTFTQEEVNALVGQARQDERRKASTKYADYDEVKAKAANSGTLEERIAEMERRAADAEARALRSDIAAKFGIAPEDRDLFLTAADEDTLTAQAERLAAREADRKQRGNVAPKEGGAADNSPGRDDMREFTRNLFARAETP